MKSYLYHITDFWAQSYRYERIAEVLERKAKLTKEDMMRFTDGSNEFICK